jgi:branched-chain amino acid transport system ATP-binding protein
MLSLQEVSAGYGDIPITRDVTLDVAEGEVVALVGRNGVGKSTLARPLSACCRSNRESSCLPAPT